MHKLCCLPRAHFYLNRAVDKDLSPRIIAEGDKILLVLFWQTEIIEMLQLCSFSGGTFFHFTLTQRERVDMKHIVDVCCEKTWCL